MVILPTLFSSVRLYRFPLRGHQNRTRIHWQVDLPDKGLDRPNTTDGNQLIVHSCTEYDH